MPALLALALTALSAAPLEPPRLRLPGDVRPVRQSVELALDPAAERYTGAVEIELRIERRAAVVWLNATGLEITSASLGEGGRLRRARVVPGGEDFVGLAPESGATLAPGPARLRAAFTAPLSRVESEGLFAVRERGEWYAFSQFEPIAARRAFPCFDEPAFKVPWTITLRVPAGLGALSNTPARSRRDATGRAA